MQKGHDNRSRHREVGFSGPVDANGQVVIRRQLKRRYILAFFRSCRRAWLVSKLAPRRIIGRANFKPLATPWA